MFVPCNLAVQQPTLHFLGVVSGFSITNRIGNKCSNYLVGCTLEGKNNKYFIGSTHAHVATLSTSVLTEGAETAELCGQNSRYQRLVHRNQKFSAIILYRSFLLSFSSKLASERSLLARTARFHDDDLGPKTGSSFLCFRACVQVLHGSEDDVTFPPRIEVRR